jgi:hypothetical protein
VEEEDREQRTRNVTESFKHKNNLKYTHILEITLLTVQGDDMGRTPGSGEQLAGGGSN